MFNIDTDTGGAKGPFINFKNRAGQGMGDGTWYMREKDGDDWHFTDMTEILKGGVVADIFATHDGQLGGSLQMGYIKFPAEGSGGNVERKWWASPLAREARPDEGKTAQGGFEWQNIVNFRVAIGGGRDALFDVSGWSGYKGVMALIEAMNGGFSANLGKCPVFQYTGFRVEGQGTKRLHVPEFAVAQWVDRPACLTPAAPTIQTQQEEAPAPTPQPAAITPPPATAAATAAIPAAGTF